MASVLKHGMMAQNMKDITLMAKSMDKGCLILLMDLNMKDNLIKIILTELALILGKTVGVIRVNGKIIK